MKSHTNLIGKSVDFFEHKNLTIVNGKMPNKKKIIINDCIDSKSKTIPVWIINFYGVERCRIK